MRLTLALCLSAATAYTPPRRTPRSPWSPGGKNPPPQRKRELVVEPLDSWGAFDAGTHRMGCSTVSWGDPANGFTKKKKKRGGTFGQKDCRLAYSELMEGGVSVFAVPGGSAAIDVFGKAVKKAKVLDPPKVVAYCAPSLRARFFGNEENRKRFGFASVATTTNDALDVMGAAFIDACLVGPPLPGSASGATKALGALKSAGNQIESVGVANVVGGSALRSAYNAFERKGLQLKVCYVDFSLVDNRALRDGTLATAKELDITVLARSPLASGLGSGEVTERNPTGGAAGAAPKWRPRALRQLAPLHDAIEQVCGMVQARRADDERNVAQKQGRDAGRPEKVTPVQVALQWVRAKGAVPLPAVKTQAHAQELLKCQGWALEAAEVKVLDAALPSSVPKFARLR